MLDLGKEVVLPTSILKKVMTSVEKTSLHQSCAKRSLKYNWQRKIKENLQFSDGPKSIWYLNVQPSRGNYNGKNCVC